MTGVKYVDFSENAKRSLRVNVGGVYKRAILVQKPITYYIILLRSLLLLAGAYWLWYTVVQSRRYRALVV